MRSSLPKALHKIAGRSMLAHVLDVGAPGGRRRACRGGRAGARGRRTPKFCARRRMRAVFVQAERLGTAHAVLAAREALAQGFDDVLVVFADTPLVRPETFALLREKLTAGAGVVALGFEPADPDRLWPPADRRRRRAAGDSRAQGRERRRNCEVAPVQRRPDGARRRQGAGLAGAHWRRQRPEGILSARRGRDRAARRRLLRHRHGARPAKCWASTTRRSWRKPKRKSSAACGSTPCGRARP